MDTEVKKKWITALRSGEYKQGRGFLRKKDDTFCCLGVLCEVLELESRLSGGYYGYEGSTQVLSHHIAEKLSLRDMTLYQLIHMNDHDKSFEEIADWIEENL